MGNKKWEIRSGKLEVGKVEEDVGMGDVIIEGRMCT